MNKNKKTQFLIHCAVITSVIIISAFIKIPFPLVPITMQTFAVILCAFYLGGQKTSVSVGIYIIIGLAGLPVFSSGGGIGYLMKPTFGYMLGMIPAATIAEMIVKKSKKRTYLTYLLASFAATGIIYLVGVPYLYFITNKVLLIQKEFGKILYSGFLLTLPGDIIKCIVASLAAKKLPPLNKY